MSRVSHAMSPVGLSIAATLALTGCVTMPRIAAPAPTAAPFPVVAFFTGHSRGDGALRVLTRAPRHISVVSNGQVAPDGSLRVEQTVAEQGRAPRQRAWVIREVAPGRFAGTLSDAAGPVSGVTGPGRLVLRFPMRGGLSARQVLTLATDGRSARNILTVSRFGLRLAVLDETIVRDEPLQPEG